MEFPKTQKFRIIEAAGLLKVYVNAPVADGKANKEVKSYRRIQALP